MQIEAFGELSGGRVVAGRARAENLQGITAKKRQERMETSKSINERRN